MRRRLPGFPRVLPIRSRGEPWRRPPARRATGSASTPAAPSPISSRSIPPRAPCASPRWRARRPIRRSALVRGVRGDPRAGRRGRPTDVAGLAHGTTVATNALLQGEIDSLGLIVTDGLPPYSGDRAPVGARGLRQLLFLGEARPHRAAASRARGRRPAQFQGRGAAAARRGQRPRGGALLPRAGHPRRRHLPDPFLRQRRARAPRRRDRRRGISRVRAVAVLRRAAGIPRIRARRDHAGRRFRQAAHGALSAPRPRRARRELKDKPFLVMQSSGGVASAGRGGAQADHHRAVGPGGRRARQRGDRGDRGLSRTS